MDFGPSNISHVVRFFGIVESMLEKHQKICLISTGKQRIPNAVFLLSCYMTFVLKMDADEVLAELDSITSHLEPFRDASNLPTSYPLYVKDCLMGLKKAISLKLFSFSSFNLRDYENHERVEQGDFNWVVPSKILALAGPCESNYQKFSSLAIAKGEPTFGFPQLIRYFKDNNIKAIIRLNNHLYKKEIFESEGIQHVDLFFPDGSNPPLWIVNAFIEICESLNGAVAVHCKAGLGRTGTLIAAYLMKKYKFTSRQAMGFIRIMRPGSIVGPQQEFIEQ